MKDFKKTWLKQITTVEELTRRLQAKAEKLKVGQSAQFFINGEARYLVRTKENFVIRKTKE